MTFDLVIRNGTVVDGLRVSSSSPVPLKIGEQVTFGGMTVRIVDAHQLYLVLLGRSPWGNR